MLFNAYMKTSGEIRRENLLIATERMGTASRLAEAAGVSAAYLSQVKNQHPESKTGKPKAMGDDVARRIEAALGEPEGWMDTRHDASPKAPEKELGSGPEFKTARLYPLISWVEAGAWTELCDNFAPGEAEMWRPCHKDLGECGYILRVQGNSMTAEEGAPFSFPEGILIYVNPDLSPDPGRFVVVRRNSTNEATFKKLVLVDGELYLEALNPRWPSRYLKLEEGDHFCGVVQHAGFDLP